MADSPLITQITKELGDLYHELYEAALRLKRGCECDYDYRCTNCSRVLDVKEKAEEITNLLNKLDK